MGNSSDTEFSGSLPIGKAVNLATALLLVAGLAGLSRSSARTRQPAPWSSTALV